MAQGNGPGGLFGAVEADALGVRRSSSNQKGVGLLGVLGREPWLGGDPSNAGLVPQIEGGARQDHHGRTPAGADEADVLAEGDILPPMQRVFDRPVRPVAAAQHQQPRRICPPRGRGW